MKKLFTLLMIIILSTNLSFSQKSSKSIKKSTKSTIDYKGKRGGTYHYSKSGKKVYSKKK